MKIQGSWVIMFILIGMLSLGVYSIYATALEKQNNNELSFYNENLNNVLGTSNNKVVDSDIMEGSVVFVVFIVLFAILCSFLGVSWKDLTKHLNLMIGKGTDYLPGGD